MSREKKNKSLKEIMSKLPDEFPFIGYIAKQISTEYYGHCPKCNEERKIKYVSEKGDIRYLECWCKGFQGIKRFYAIHEIEIGSISIKADGRMWLSSLSYSDKNIFGQSVENVLFESLDNGRLLFEGEKLDIEDCKYKLFLDKQLCQKAVDLLNNYQEERYKKYLTGQPF